MVNITCYSESGDGRIFCTGNNYSSINNQTLGTSLDYTGNYLTIRNDFIGDYTIGRVFVPFNTSLESGTIIYDGYLSFYCESTMNDNNDTLVLVRAYQANISSLELADYDNIESVIGSEIGVSSIPTFSYFNLSLNTSALAWINTTGYSKFGLRLKGDIDNSAPTGENFVSLNSIERGEPFAPCLILNVDTANISYILNQSISISANIPVERKIELSLNISEYIEATKEATYVIGDEYLPTPPKFKLLEYTVVQEFGTAYSTADIKFQGTEIPSIDEYIQLVQTDFETQQKKIIFYGFPIEVTWKLKKDLVEADVKAVTNGWYLTQQMPSQWECSTPDYEEHLNNQPWDQMYYYPRMNEIMLLWDYLNYIPGEAAVEGGLSVFTMRPTGFNSWYYKWTEPMIATRWYLLTGVAPSYELTEEVSNLVDTYMPCSTPLSYDPSCYIDIPDGLGKVDDAKEWAFDDFRTTKYDAIIQMADYCNRVFHMRLAQSDTNLTRYQPPGGYYDKGTLVCYWTRNTSANSTIGPEPFDVLLNITAGVDNTLIEIQKEERGTERTLPNVVKVGSIESTTWASGGYERNESSYPCDWWQKAVGSLQCGAYWFIPRRPIQHFLMTENLSQNEVEDYVKEYYDRVVAGEVKYTASLLSTICERTSPYRPILPGSRIRIHNISNHTDEEMRIMRIIHRKTGASPATTELEYYTVYDLAHPNTFESGILERVLAASERAAELGYRINTYQNIKNPRATGVGSQPFITPVEVIAVDDAAGTADVRILNTGGKVKNVITF